MVAKSILLTALSLAPSALAAPVVPNPLSNTLTSIPAPPIDGIRPEDYNRLTKRGNDFTSSSVKLSSTCDKDLPKNPRNSDELIFLEAANFRARAQPWCTQMKTGLKNDGKAFAKENVQDMSNFVKPDNLNHGVSRVINVSMTLTDEGKKELQKDDEALNGFCLYAFENYGTKGDGCTKEQKYWKGIKGATTTGVKGGSSKLSHGGKELGSLKVTYE
ncbi:hypothetical protein SI65_00244 [Aspergillus cristatus]|uniref:Ecp2 effector protein domain-containing protein n=1 Tax=Aspergillus cristatus TaxID=573508 RepID=A0A1E3BNX5_ASPCR|nr:hypothetical protein SI65_00244 [Aspergillus cristatus]